MEENCPPTPLDVRDVRSPKSPSQMTASSADSDGIKSPNDRMSPDSRCVICLGKLEKKAFTDSCLHQFCFQCLLQWSKVKPECPLCKQPFKSIIHNVRSNYDYDQYHVERREPTYVVSEILQSYDFDLVPVERRFRYRSTMTREYFGELAESFLARTRTAYQVPNFVTPPTYHIPSSGRFSPVAVRGGSGFRRRIYEQDLWVQDLVDVTGRYRECTPQFYRENPAQIHRIIPWLNREINSLLDDYESYTSYVLDRIVALFPQHSITSREFRDAVEPYFGRRTDHFIHELHTFARSVYDITGFDQNAVYALNPNYGTEVQEISSSNDDSEIEVIGTLQQKIRFRRSSRLRKFSRLGNDVHVHSVEPVPGPSGINSRRVTETIDVCESDNDDIKVIEYVKPVPEVVVVSSGDEQNTKEVGNRSQLGNKDEPTGEGHGKLSKYRKGKRHRSNNGKIRKKRTSSSSSFNSIINISGCNDSDSSLSVHNRSSSMDSEVCSKFKRKKFCKRHNKKFKKSDRKSLSKDKEGSSCSSTQELKKAKVKSCVVVPSSSDKRLTSNTALDKDGKYHYPESRRSYNDVSSPLPSYWSLMLEDKSEKHRKRKRSREDRTNLSAYKTSRRDIEEESEDDKSYLRRKKISLSPRKSHTSDSLSESVAKSGDYLKCANSESVKSENSSEINGESKLTDVSEDDSNYCQSSLSRQHLRNSSNCTLGRFCDGCDETNSE